MATGHGFSESDVRPLNVLLPFLGEFLTGLVMLSYVTSVTTK
jgi:hypothetical protein